MEFLLHSNLIHPRLLLTILSFSQILVHFNLEVFFHPPESSAALTLVVIAHPAFENGISDLLGLLLFVLGRGGGVVLDLLSALLLGRSLPPVNFDRC